MRVLLAGYLFGATETKVGGGTVRNYGVKAGLLRMRRHDHIGVIFEGAAEFAALVVPYLAEGLLLGERVMYVTDSPDVSAVRRLRTNVTIRGTRTVIGLIAELAGPLAPNLMLREA